MKFVKDLLYELPSQRERLSLADYKPRIKLSGVPQQIISFLPSVARHLSSEVFIRMLELQVRSTRPSHENKWWDVVCLLWSKTCNEFDTACNKIKAGNITLAEVQTMFSCNSEDTTWLDYCQKELPKMASTDNSGWVQERLKQMKCLSDLTMLRDAARIISTLKQDCQFSGDIDDIDNFLRVDMNLQLKDLNPSVIETSSALSVITREQVDCLRQFQSETCAPFVQWVRDTMSGDGLQEVKVFVDLALNYVGDNTVDMDKVRNLQAVITGYAPLIFQSGTRAGSFLQRCYIVCQNIAADQNLPKKLESTITYLKWFDEIHKFHGSVEKTALAQVESISQRGILKLCKEEILKRDGVHDITLSRVICLEVPEDNDSQSKAKTYTYQEMTDLQSRLMLVVGHAERNDENVKQFISIMDSVERLATLYVQLCRDGCLLFLDWNVKFFCDQTINVRCITEFFHGKSANQKFKGLRESHTLGAYIAMVATFLEDCGSQWLSYVAKIRRKYMELNMYTMEQLVFLQEQLVLHKHGSMNRHIFQLLSLLRPNCGPDHVHKAMKNALEEVEAQNKSNDKDKATEEDTNALSAAKFIQYMRDNGFSQFAATEALRRGANPNDLDQGLEWCIEHAEELKEGTQQEDPREDSQTLSSDSALQTLISRKETIAMALKLLEIHGTDTNMSLETMFAKLKDVWERFLATIVYSGEDCLSLEHLGLVLKYLAQQDDREFKRRLPSGLKPGSPNFLLCPRNDVLDTVTSLYMTTTNAPLPQTDEVLLCTPETTFEQVNMFLLRAFSTSSFEKGKLHCMAFADCLDFDSSEKTEKQLNEYVNTIEHEYQLVVICTKENEFKSHISAALEKNLCSTLVFAKPKIQSYLQRKLTTGEDVRDEQAAASVDSERVCVRLVKSTRSGMGKTLYIKRLAASLESILTAKTDLISDKHNDRCEIDDDSGEKSILIREHSQTSVTIPLYEKTVDARDVASRLMPYVQSPGNQLPRIIHLDISYEVLEGVDILLYCLLILGCITDYKGHAWLRSTRDLYLIEAMPLFEHSDDQKSQLLVHKIFHVLPSMTCWSPVDCLSILKREEDTNLVFSERDQLFDDKVFQSEVFQRPVHYLSTIHRRQQPKPFIPGNVQTGSKAKVACLEIIIKHCGVKSPSWSELYHFASFLNKQLQDFENSVFCGLATSHDLPGFSAFVLRFVIHMSRDFATRSLVIAEESIPALAVEKESDDDSHGLEKFQMRRKWESSPHPYIFFNPDANSMTFLGFTIHQPSGNLLDQNGRILERNIMRRDLYHSLLLNNVPLSEEFDILPREERLQRLYQVMGLAHDEITDEKEQIIDPDTTYELTTDNVKKILAIYMRFRCNIPVVIMGETGCGKTRLVKFMCALQTPKHPSINTMVLMKVHGGTTVQDIGQKVEEAEKIAKKIKEQFRKRVVYTVLFFDEANTTEAIGAIKEVMCDSAFNGKSIRLNANLKMVAACNPYKKHTSEVIERLEKAGLGYHVSADKTSDKLGRLPMRQLVYRVQPLPQSMLPLVWDFGQLTLEAEYIYITHMVIRFIRNGQLGQVSRTQFNTICRILTMSQTFMRQKHDECSFVSLRDADRALTVCSWFLRQHEVMHRLDCMLQDWRVDHITKSLVLALGVCYRAGLRSKFEYDRVIVPFFGSDFRLDGGEKLFRLILDSCADLMLDNIKPVEKIARNQALKENVFMMVVCVELRIPLFLVGKPGSSKSLAKTLIADAMRGVQSHGELFRSLKEAQMVSFQCSPLSTADGILATFRQCAHIQKDKDKDKFVSVAVLDEVGLAEDSPKMPLKALHPLLEEGCEVQDKSDETEEVDEDFDETRTEFDQDDSSKDPIRVTHEKVAFIGISNWALDPAKMNRGLLVQREVPDEEELVQTAEGICNDADGVLGFVKDLLKKLAKAYLKIFNEAINKREFFGLRDFYSMVKMVHTYAKEKKRKLTRAEFHMAVLRNFGGLDSLDPVEIFEDEISLKDLSRERDCQIHTPLQMALLEENIGRYLLLLTESNVGLRILTDILKKDHVVPIYGSSFPKDQGYTQVCSNINRIKGCMETGKIVILLHLDNLYESLYDALNQSYSVLAGVRYVDLGLGSHRVKCKVDTNFRLIVVAEKHTVYEKFPIPLINRLEKHFLTVSNILDKAQQEMETELKEWVDSVVRLSNAEHIGDIFIGFHQDSLASVILMFSDQSDEDGREMIMERCKSSLLWIATPDAIIRLEDTELSRVYFQEQQHDNLAQYLKARLACTTNTSLMSQVTTHSRILTEKERKKLEEDLPEFKFTLYSLQAFQTEQQFIHSIRMFLGTTDGEEKKVLIVQCESGNLNQTLLQCAQYCVQSEWPFQSSTRHVVFTVQLPRIASTAFMGFQGGKWHCVHIDELRSSSMPLPELVELQTKSPAQLLSYAHLHKLDVSQVHLQLQEDEQDKSTGLHKDLIHHLMVNSVQMAMACIRDREDSDRSMQRITILLQCLENTNNDTFYRGLWRLMISIMDEVEAQTPEIQNWLAQDAARLEWVKKTGTFRRAWMQSLQKFLVPVLAGVVAFLDTNSNLNFMDNQSKILPWLQNLWLDIFNKPFLCNLKLKDLLSLSTRQNELTELVCRSTFLAGPSTSAELPFSWIISELVDRLLIRLSSEQQEEGVDTGESEIKCFLQGSITSEEVSSDFLYRYAGDLLHAHFRLNPQNHQLIVQCLMGAVRQDGLSLEPYNIGRSLLQIHRILFQVRPRLLAVLDMTACHPKAIQELQEKLSDRQNVFWGADEMTEDVLLLSMLLEELSPQNDQLNTDKGCRAWLDQFNLVAPVISRVITDIDANLEPNNDLSDGKDAKYCFQYGQRCQQQLDNIRCQWMRVQAVKLFIDYMSPLVRDSNTTQLDSKRVNYMLLANLLAKKDNLKTKEALLNVDKFLKHANGQMVRGLLGEVGSCMHCTTKLEGPPVLLPCSHRICNKCYTQEAKVGQKCPECQNSIPESFNRDNCDLPNREAVNQLLRYQRQSSSFLMALVSQLCFSGRAPPEPDAVEHIFGYVIRRETSTSTIRTKQLTLHDDQIDPSPVLRSFLLRLLLQYSEKEVSQHITRFLEDAKSMIQQQVGAERNAASVLTELSLLVIHCIENLQHEKEALDEKRNEDEAHGLKCKNQCSYIADLLHEVRRVLESSPLELSTLISMGRLRYALDSCARVLHACVIEPKSPTTLNADVKDLMKVASCVCEMGSTDWPKKFLIKQLCREYGIESFTILIQRAKQEKCLKWLQLDNVNEVEEVPDRYLLCGEKYLNLRTEIMQAMRGIEGELEQKLTLMDCTIKRKEYLIMLALHREVTMACVNENSLALQADLQAKAQVLVQSAKLGIDEDFAWRVCANSFGIPESPLCANVGQSLAEQSLVCVLTHYWMALRAVEQLNDIALPFTTIINQPDSMLTSYLPTMPEDHVEEIAQALAIDPNSAYHHIRNPETPKMYECPNGHRYIIGNCGNPNSQSRCPECGILIGGKAYVPAEGNLQVSTEDRTKPGHTLGPAENRSREAIPERHMSATVCAVLRFLTHASLFLSASQPQQANIVIQMVKPPLPDDKSVVMFFWEHLQLDVQVLARAFHRCCDDVYLLLHALCHYLSERQPVKLRPLTSKNARKEWEKQFCDLIILPMLKQAEVIIQQGNQLIVNDTRQGQNQLLNLIFEVGEEDVPDPDKELQHTAVPWKYRTRITVDHFFDNFQLHMEERKGGAKEYPVLKLFQAESLYLRALHYVPDILEHQHRLMQRLRQRLNREEAAKMTVSQALENKECGGLQELLRAFSTAWDMVKTHLISYRCMTDEGLIQLPAEFHNVTVNVSSPLALLLPATRGPGLCSYILIHFLLVQHNSFMEAYCPLVKQRYEQLPEITVQDITKRHLLGYSPQSDLLPLVLGHCNYSLHLGHTGSSAAQLDYDFQGFELQLRNTLLLGKSRIAKKENGSLQIETMVYIADTTTSRLFSRLRDKIPQISLSSRVRREIAQDLKGNIPDICQSMDNINTALMYILSLRTDAEKNLCEFMRDTLKMRDTIHSRKAQNHSCLKHVQSLWLLLCMERSAVLASHNQEAFDGQGGDLRKDFQNDQNTALETALKRLKPERLELLLWQLFECIMLRLVQHVGEDFASPDNYSIYWLVCDNLSESPLYAEPPEETKEELLTEDDLKHFPQSLTASQAIPTWLAVHRHLAARVQQVV